YGNGLHLALRCSKQLEAEGVRARVVDLRWLVPLDRAVCLKQAREVGRVLVLDECRRTAGPSEEILAAFVEEHVDVLVARGAEAAVAEVAAAVDRAREKHGLRSIREIDQTRPFSTELHGEAQNASALIFALSWVDHALLPRELETAGVTGNSLGFYTALAVSQ